MKPYRAIAVISLIVTLSVPQCCMAWGADGHQAIGAIADALLVGSNAERRLHRLLGDSSLEVIAVWADCAKAINPAQDFSYGTLGRRSECAVFETPYGIAAMRDFVRRNDSNCARKLGEESCHKQYHYADVAIQDTRYQAGAIGSNEVDIVHALTASIKVLQGKPCPPPFNIKDAKEALILLAHYIGDVHQPLHVGAIYLANDGTVITPLHDERPNHTIGGNALTLGESNLHSYWDAMPSTLKHGKMREELLQGARAVKPTLGGVDTWPTQWASETLTEARLAFQEVRFDQRQIGLRGATWATTLPADYDERSTALKAAEIAKAGARLAQLLRTILAD